MSTPTPAEWKALAAHFKSEHPEAYFDVTGLPTWWDAVGAEWHAAEAKWLRYVKRNAQVQP